MQTIAKPESGCTGAGTGGDPGRHPEGLRLRTLGRAPTHPHTHEDLLFGAWLSRHLSSILQSGWHLDLAQPSTSSLHLTRLALGPGPVINFIPSFNQAYLLGLVANNFFTLFLLLAPAVFVYPGPFTSRPSSGSGTTKCLAPKT